MTEYDQKRLRPGNETRDRIIKAAISIFGKKGYRNTTLKDVAEIVGVSHVMVLKYFETKENLLSEAYRYATNDAYPFPKEEQILRDRVEELIRQSIDVMNDKPQVFDFFMMLLCTSDLPESYQIARHEWFDQTPIYPLMDTWQKQRELPEGDLFEYFMTFMRTVYTILDFYRKLSHLQEGQSIDPGLMLSHIVRMIEENVNNKGPQK